MKQPIIVDAIQYTDFNKEEVFEFLVTTKVVSKTERIRQVLSSNVIRFMTRKSSFYVYPTEWIVVMPNGYVDIYKDSQFHDTHVLAPA